MSRSDVSAAGQVPGQQIDVVNGGDVHPSGRLLSVAEIQQAFRELRQQHAPPQASAAATLAAPHPECADQRDSAPPTTHTFQSPVNTVPHTSSDAAATVPHTSRTGDLPTDLDGPHTSGSTSAPSSAADSIGADWVAVVSAHSGAGASCVALAIADALADSTQACQLIEAAHPARSGLLAAATAELGMDPTGAWRRGSRGSTTLYRRASATAPGGWPEPPGTDAVTTVVDLGLPAPANVSRLVTHRPSIVLVCRVTVPGIRLAEHLLAELAGTSTVLAAVGPGRWPGEVLSSLGPHVRGLREGRRVVSVPDDRHLQVTGPTNSPLPKSVSHAGRELLGLIDATRPGGVGAPPNLTAPSAPRKKGSTR